MTDKVAAIRSEIERRIEEYKANESNAWYSSDYGDEDALWWQGHWKSLSKLLAFIDSMLEEPKTLEEEITYFSEWMKHNGLVLSTAAIAHHFAEWGAEHLACNNENTKANNNEND